MTRRSQICGVGLALVALHAHANAQPWRGAAEDALLRTLRQEYASVEAWTVEPLLSKRQQDRLADMDFGTAIVTRTGKRSAVRVAAHGGDRDESTTVWFAVSAMQSVPAAAATLRQGQIVAAAGLTTASKDIFTLGCTPLLAGERAVGMRLKSTIAAGNAICSESLEPAPLVARGEVVSVRSTAGLVTITTTGVAQQDGSLGKMLKIRNAANGETFFAAVTGRAEVAVHE